MITLTALCLVIGIYMLFCGIFVGILEAPLLFSCCEIFKPMIPKVSQVEPIHRAVMYAM